MTVKQLQAKGVRILRLVYADLYGVQRGKDVLLERAAHAISHGKPFVEAVMTIDHRHNIVSGDEVGPHLRDGVLGLRDGAHDRVGDAHQPGAEFGEAPGEGVGIAHAGPTVSTVPARSRVSQCSKVSSPVNRPWISARSSSDRSEEHTSELQSH